MPQISVIVPVYNVEPYLRRCVDSILAQTFTDFELILVDDGSPDGCPAICDEYAEKDSRVHVIHQQNGGVSSARNAGLDISKGSYIAFIDSDDFIDINYLEVLWSNRTDLTLMPSITYDEHGNYLWGRDYKDTEFKSRENIDFELICTMLYSPYCRLFLKRVVDSHNIRFPQGVAWGEDAIFGARYSLYIQSVKILSWSGYHYIKYDKEESLSSKIRYDIVDTIVHSREQYLSILLEGVPSSAHEIITKKITEDILKNSAFFVSKIFLSRDLSNEDRTALLNHFLENHYVRETIYDSEKYYNRMICESLKYKNPVRHYNWLCRKKTLSNGIKQIPKSVVHKLLGNQQYSKLRERIINL